jgi:hypothetical protein
VLATVSTLIDPCSTSIKRDVPSHSARIVEPCASLGPLMSVVTVAARRHILKELVHKKAIHRVSFSRDI